VKVELKLVLDTEKMLSVWASWLGS